MKTKYYIIIAISVGLVLFFLNYRVEYEETVFAYLFCEGFLFSGTKSCSVIWQEPDCPGGGCLFK